MERKLILKKNKLTDILTARSDEQHLYDYVLILTEKPVFSQTGEVIILNDSPSYNYIKNAIVRKQSSPLSCKIGKAYMKIEVSEGKSLKLLRGSSAFHRETEVFYQNMIHLLLSSDCKSKNKKLRIKTEWKF